MSWIGFIPLDGVVIYSPFHQKSVAQASGSTTELSRVPRQQVSLYTGVSTSVEI